MDWRERIGRWGGAVVPGMPWMRSAFLLLLALATLLRAWAYGDLPYMHDEISALNRLYPTLWETIRRGVMAEDTHPPGVQIFEWLWTRLFGVHEVAVKLPFTLAAIVALLLIHRTAMAWTSPAAALVLIAYLAVAQYFVMYAQIARPYAMGLFTTAWLADRLTRYLATCRPVFLWWAVVAAVLSAYVHHFSMMLAALMMASALLLVRPGQRNSYMLACGVGVLAYLPNLPIFLHQLSLGGLAEWLAPPDRYWAMDHLRWLAHDSRVFAGVLGLIGMGALIGSTRKGAWPGPAKWVLPVWGALPLIIGLAYSILLNPVVQYSMLIFSFPYLALVPLSGLHVAGKRLTIAACVLVAVAGTWSLVGVRHHYRDFYTGNYDMLVRTAAHLHEQHGSEGLVVAFDAPDGSIRYQRMLLGMDDGGFPYVQLRGDRTAAILDSLLMALGDRMLFLGLANNGLTEPTAMAQARLSFVVDRLDLPEAQAFLLSAEPCANGVDDREILALATPQRITGDGWDVAAHLPVVHDSLGLPMGWDMTGHDFGVLCEVQLDTVVQDPYDRIEVVLALNVAEPGADVGLVLELTGPDGTYFYRTAELGQLGRSGDVHLVLAAHAALAPRNSKELRLRTYIHVRDGSAVLVRSMALYRRDADPLMHTLFGRMRPGARHDWTRDAQRRSGKPFGWKSSCMP